MAYCGRKKENLRNVVIILVALIGLFGITMHLRSLKVAEEVVKLEEVESRAVVTEEKDIELDIDKLYESMNQAVNQHEISQVVAQVSGGNDIPVIEIENREHSYSVTLTYNESSSGQSVERVKKEQVVLLDTCLLMSLFPKVDVVIVRDISDEGLYEKVMYRPDIEDYFGTSLVDINSKDAFERVANEFLSREVASAYWNRKHPYDSKLGEEVEKFFKCNFPSQWKTDDALPYIDEALEADLFEQYGYKLFIQGLNYDHPLMNYYSAYRLIECYGNSNTDEILLELASCRSSSENKQVQAACTFVMNVLSGRLEENEILIFTRFSESVLQGGKKLYGILGDKLVEIASWQGEEAGGFEVISVSNNKKNVLCKIHTSEKSYLYMIPIDNTGGYVVNEMTVQKGEQDISSEITNRMKEAVLDETWSSDVLQNINEGTFQSRWLFGNVIVFAINEELSFVYDVDKGSLMNEILFNEGFDTTYLLQGLRERFSELTEREILTVETKFEIREVYINQEKLLIYEYNSSIEKNLDLIKEKQGQEMQGKEWRKGKLYVTYDGNQTAIIDILNKLMAE